jgi:CubicO group peptidase (beta-lactamase class C family)
VLKNTGDHFNSADINLDNWKDFPYSAHTFQNVAELIPVHEIAGPGTAELPIEINPSILNNCYEISGQVQTGSDFLQISYTNALLVVKRGTIVAEYFANSMNITAPHLTFSVSKSITGIIAGIVLKKFGLNADIKVSSIIDGTAGGAYADATVRNLLDMSASLDFDESYASKEGLYARYRQAMLWMNRDENSEHLDEDLENFILALPKATHEHGHRFSYKSPNSDLLGLVLQKISGLPLAKLISQELWQPLGCAPATITIDSKEMARTAGGLSCSIKDLALVGELIRNGGIHNGESLLNPMWVVDTFAHGDIQAWARGEFYSSFPKGAYRNQWYSIGEGELCAIGIHGQWIYINTKEDVVITKFSCQPTADDDELDRKNLDFFRAVSSSC